MNTHQPLVWAHRGASRYAPENTKEAFRMAVEQKADGIELDVQLTKDQQIVVLHDETLERTSTGTGWVKDFTLEQLRAFNFNRTHPEFSRADIPTLEEVLALIAPTGLTLNIELKTGVIFYPDLEKKVLSLVKAYAMQDRVIYSSFNHYSIARLLSLDPTAQAGLLYSDGYIDMPSYGARMGVNALHPALWNLQYPDFVEDCALNDLDIHVWTVDEPEHIRLCCQLGVRAIITNDPANTRRVIESLT